MDRLKEAGVLADRSGSEETHRAGDAAGLVREDVAEGVFGDHHVEEFRSADEFHGCVVHEHVVHFDVRVGSFHSLGDLSPESGGLKYVGLVDHRQVLAPAAGELECQLEDALDLGTAVDVGVIGSVAAVLASLLSEVHSTGEFPDADEICSVHELGLQRRLVGEGLECLDRTDVGVEPEFLADCEETLLWTYLGCRVIVVFRVADGSEEHCVAGHADAVGLLRIRIPALIDCAGSHESLPVFNCVAEFSCHCVYCLHGLPYHFRADAVSRHQCYLDVHFFH